MQRMRRDDDGAVAVLMAILMMALLGAGAIVLDAGSLYAERRQLQNGADAAVLAAAIDCPVLPDCTGTALLQATLKADQNANDGRSDVASPSGPAVCGRGGSLLSCNPVSGLGPWDCRPLPTGALETADFVQVRTQTRRDDADNPSLMPPLLARVLAPGYDGTTVRACARASWGAPAGLASGLPLTISDCEFEWMTGAGFAPPPPYPPYPPGYEQVIHFHSQDGPSPCPTSGAGSDLPGGFGWLDTGADCQIVTNSDGDATADPGVSPPNACSPEYMKSLIGTVIYIPVFDRATLSGNNGTYSIKGYAAFVLTGYWFTGQYREPSIVTGLNYCTGEKRCIYGFFTEELAPVSGTIGTGVHMGVTVVQLSG